MQNILKKLKSKKLICVSPDVGGVQRTRGLATRIKADLAIIDKKEDQGAGQSKVMNIIGDVKGKTCIIVDDIIDSGGTIVNAVEALKAGAIDVYVFITHAVLSGAAVDKIKKSKIKKLIITDTIDNSKNKK